MRDTRLARLSLDFRRVLSFITLPSIHQALRHHLQSRTPDEGVTARTALTLIKARYLASLAPRVRPDTGQDLLGSAERGVRGDSALAAGHATGFRVCHCGLVASAGGQRGDHIRPALLAQGRIAEVLHHAGDAAGRGIVGGYLAGGAGADGGEGLEALLDAGHELVARGAQAVVDGLLAVRAGDEAVEVARGSTVRAAVGELGHLALGARRQLREGAFNRQLGLATGASTHKRGGRPIRADRQRRDITIHARIRPARGTAIGVGRDRALGAESGGEGEVWAVGQLAGTSVRVATGLSFDLVEAYPQNYQHNELKQFH